MACSGANGPDASHLPMKHEHEISGKITLSNMRHLDEGKGNMLTIYQQQLQTSQPRMDQLIVHPGVFREFAW